MQIEKKYAWQVGAFITAALILAILLLSGAREYEIWPQIDYLHRTVLDAEALTTNRILAHVPRYAVVAPSYYIAAWLGVAPDKVFAWYVFSLVTATAWIWLHIRILVAHTPPTRYFLFLLPFLLALLINGRFAFGLFGLSVILLALVRGRLGGWRFWHIGAGLAGLLYTSVSSGIFVVGLLFAVLTIISFMRIDNAQRGVRVQPFLLGAVIVLLGLPLLALCWVFVLKNMTYYGGGLHSLLDMLSHGLGLIVHPQPLVNYCRAEGNVSIVCRLAEVLAASRFVSVMLGIALFSAATGALLWLRKSGLLTMARRGILLSLLGGFFGLTTLFSVLFILPVWLLKQDSHPLLVEMH